MLSQQNDMPPTPPQAPDGAVIFDADMGNFESAVMQTSMEVPVLVDFWAPWCGPCKQLGPVLEEAVTAARGKVRLAKINIDQNQQLAAALQVQSVPTVFALYQGRPVNAFTGARPPGEIKAFIDEIIKLSGQEEPGTLDLPETLKEAAHALAEGNLGMAHGLYAKILQQDETCAEAFAGLIRVFIEAKDVTQARHMVDSAPDAIAKTPAFEAARAALELSESRPSEGRVYNLAGRVEKDPNDHEARFELAQALFAHGQKEEALDALLEIIRRDREWEEQKARKALLKFFDILGAADPLTAVFRKKLSVLLFS